MPPTGGGSGGRPLPATGPGRARFTQAQVGPLSSSQLTKTKGAARRGALLAPDSRLPALPPFSFSISCYEKSDFVENSCRVRAAPYKLLRLTVLQTDLIPVGRASSPSRHGQDARATANCAVLGLLDKNTRNLVTRTGEDTCATRSFHGFEETNDS